MSKQVLTRGETKVSHLRLVAAELSVAVCKTLESDRELDITTAHDILNLELRKLGIEAQLLDNPRVLARRQTRVVFRLGASNDHLARREDQGGGLGLSDTHDNGCKTLEKKHANKEKFGMQRQRTRVLPTLGLYSALRACNAIVLRSRRQSKLTVATMF